MKSNYKRLGQYIRPVDIRNIDDCRYDLLGVSVEKRFIESIANTVGTDWKSYKVIKKGQFCYIPDTSRRGDKIGIALLLDKEVGLVSAVYTVFEVIGDALLPEYLMLWFSRPEFDRYARFHSHGSVREIFDWEEMCNVELPVPPIEEQRSIIEAYKAIERRIALKRKINDNLEAQAITLFQQTYSNCDSKQMMYGKVGDLGEFVRGKNITASEMYGGNIAVISAGIEPSGYHNQFNVVSPSITISGSGVNAGFVSYHSENIWASDCSYNNTAKYILNLYLLLKSSQAKIFDMQKGTAQPHVYPKEINSIEINYPAESIMSQLENQLKPIFQNISINLMEILSLEKTKTVFLTTISSR